MWQPAWKVAPIPDVRAAGKIVRADEHRPPAHRGGDDEGDEARVAGELAQAGKLTEEGDPSGNDAEGADPAIAHDRQSLLG